MADFSRHTESPTRTTIYYSPCKVVDVLSAVVHVATSFLWITTTPLRKWKDRGLRYVGSYVADVIDFSPKPVIHQWSSEQQQNTLSDRQPGTSCDL